MNELILKQCKECNTLVKVIKNYDSNLICCGKPMQIIKPNTTEASAEKHLPTYEKIGNTLKITVNHVMEQEHYIEWILVVGKKGFKEQIFNPLDIPTMELPYEEGLTIYSYCNKHGLWKTEAK